jgi:ribosomal protein L40E
MSNQEAIHICESCGASNASEAQFCGMCGHELLAESVVVQDEVFQGHPDANPWQSSGVPASPAPLEFDNAASSNLEEMEAAAQATPEDVKQKRCEWCGALNPWVAAVCETCGARFPVPGQDEAFRRAAEERLRQQEADLEILRRRRRGWRRWL